MVGGKGVVLENLLVKIEGEEKVKDSIRLLFPHSEEEEEEKEKKEELCLSPLRVEEKELEKKEMEKKEVEEELY